MNNLLAQGAPAVIAPPNGFVGIGTGRLANPGSSAPDLFASIISTAIGIMTIVAIIWFIFVFITGAIGVINSAGDSQSLETSRKKITQGLIGLTIVVSAIYIFDFVGYLLGFPSNALLNIVQLITDSAIK